MARMRQGGEALGQGAEQATAPRPSAGNAAAISAWRAAPSLEEVRAGRATLHHGHEGPAVGHVQGLAGVAKTGQFGDTTRDVIARFQVGRGLVPPPGMEGFVGQTTLAALEAGGGGSVTATPLAVWTTGGGSSELPADGSWTSRDLRTHHTDRTRSAAADRVRAGRQIPYESVEAWDFTFERRGADGRGVQGTAHGLPLRVPADAVVRDLQHDLATSGGYGRFILLEYVDDGERVEIHHLASVGDFRPGQRLAAGTVFGTQGGSGSRSEVDYATHIDIVGTVRAVERFVRANQQGRFSSQVVPASPETGSAPAEATPAASPEAVAEGSGGWRPAPSLADVRAGRSVLMPGMEGDAVGHVQELVGVQRTRQLGPTTRGAIAAAQARLGLTPPPGYEGAVGKTTLEALERGGAPVPAALQQGRGQFGVAGLAVSATPAVERYGVEVRAFLRAISYTEGVDDFAGYHREVGGTMYPATQDVHPGAADTRRYTRTGFDSDAYGRYQMLSTTWAAWAEAAGVGVARPGRNDQGEAYFDMSPANQDIAVLEFLRRRGVDRALAAGDRAAALRVAAPEWASLPGGVQPNSRTPRFWAVYEDMLRDERALDAARAR